jgi:hypothetical protein
MHWIDPDCLPEMKGNVERFIMNLDGEIDGLVLNGGTNEATLVHVPPHLGANIEAAFQPGETVRIRGVCPRGTRMVAAVALIAADGRTVIDNGPEDKHHKKTPKTFPKSAAVKGLKVAGKVRLSLFAPKGELRGALLEDGTIVRIGPREAQRFSKLLQPGAAVAARGDGVETRHGRVVDGKEIGSDLENLEPAKSPKHHR